MHWSAFKDNSAYRSWAHPQSPSLCESIKVNMVAWLTIIVSTANTHTVCVCVCVCVCNSCTHTTLQNCRKGICRDNKPALETSRSGQMSSCCRQQRRRETRARSSCTGASWHCTVPVLQCPRCPGHKSPRLLPPDGGGRHGRGYPCTMTESHMCTWPVPLCAGVCVCVCVCVP